MRKKSICYIFALSFDAFLFQSVKDVCFVDWQLSQYASPVLDIMFHLFLSTRKEFRDQNYADLLHIYYDSLCVTIARLGSDPEVLFRFDDLQNELKAHGKLALIMCIVTLPFIVSQPGEIVDMEEYAELVVNGVKSNRFHVDGSENLIYSEVMNEIVGDIISYGYDCYL